MLGLIIIALAWFYMPGWIAAFLTIAVIVAMWD